MVKDGAFKPTPEEQEEISRRLYVSRCTFGIWSLHGMLNTTRHVLKHVISERDMKWFEDCINYMIERIRINKDIAMRKRRK